MRQPPQIALLIETARGYGREISLGIARYARLHGPWCFHLKPGDFEQTLPSVQDWQGDGIFARIVNDNIARQLLEADLPTVALDMAEDQLDPDNPLSAFTDLCVDSHKAARLAAEHLLERHFPTYGFVGSPGHVWSDRREAAFCDAITQAGATVHVYEPQDVEGERGWERELPCLAEWMEALPKPAGIMACNDEHGLHVLDACRKAGIVVPKDVAVIGVDNDELLCELANPTLSSVVLNAVQGGFDAAGRLDEMLSCGQNSPRTIVVDALRVVTRQSTDCMALTDDQVATALALIKRSQGRDITADLVADQLDISRRILDGRFRESVGHSVVTEIQRVRLNHAMRLLQETDYPIPGVAEAAGYSSVSYMVQVFRRELKTTPAKYRAGIRRLSVEGGRQLGRV